MPNLLLKESKQAHDPHIISKLIDQRRNLQRTQEPVLHVTRIICTDIRFFPRNDALHRVLARRRRTALCLRIFHSSGRKILSAECFCNAEIIRMPFTRTPYI